MPNSKTALLSLVAVGLFLAIYAFYSQAAQCPLPVLKAYKTENNPAVYYLSSDCKKRPIKNPDVFFSHFATWSDVRPTTPAILNQIPDHALSFLPWGPRRNFHHGSLLKTVSDPRVYLVLKNKRIPIASEATFLDLGFQWGWVEDVTPEVLDRFSQAPLLNLGDTYPSGLAFKYVNSPKVYYVETNDNGTQSGRHVASFTQLAADYRTDRLATLSTQKILIDGQTITTPTLVTSPTVSTPQPKPDKLEIPPSAPLTTTPLAPSPSPTTAPPPTVPSQPFQWTQFTPSADTRVIYISGAQGQDSNNCLSEQKACRTIQRGVSLLRDGYPDWLLLRRGDVWIEKFGEWTKSGRSKSEPMLIASYGDSFKRPMLKTGFETALNTVDKKIRYLQFVGLHLTAHTNDHLVTDKNGDGRIDYPGEIFGIFLVSGGEDILIEDFRIDNYGTGISIHGNLEIPPERWPALDWRNIRLRRNTIVDNYGFESGSDGVFFASIDGILLEENLFDYNGWGEGVKLDLLTANVYVNEFGGTNNVVLRGNIISRGDGAHVRPGGTVENNLLLRSSIGLNVGLANHPVIGGITASIKDNVILEGLNQSDLDRAWGLVLENVGDQGAEVNNNIIAHGKSDMLYNREAVLFAPQWSKVSNQGKPNLGVRKVDFHDNIIYNWGGTAFFGGHTAPPAGQVKIRNNIIYDSTKRVRSGSPGQVALVSVEGIDPRLNSLNDNTYFSSEPQNEWFTVDSEVLNFTNWQQRSRETGSNAKQVSFSDPTRNVASYHQSIGGAATNEAFLTQARKQSKGTGIGVLPSAKLGTLPASTDTWNNAYTATAVNAYIRTGFGR